MKSLIKRRLARIMLVCMVLTTVVVPNTFNADAAYVSQATGKINAKKGAVIRKSPSNSAKKVMRAKNNVKITIKEEVFVSKKSTAAKKRWYAVTIGKKSGYVRADQVDSIKYSTKKKKTKDALNYRVGPTTKMKKKGTFKKGSQIDVVLQAKLKGSKTVWYKVRKGGKYYYVDARYTTNVTSGTSSAGTFTAARISINSSTAASINVKDSNGADTGITVTNLSYPISLPEGSSFTLTGQIKSPSDITEVTAGVADTSGKWIISANAKPNKTTFDIKDIDAKIKFGTLSNGSFVYKVLVTVNGKTHTAASYNFKVVKVNGPKILADNAVALAWPIGTPSSKYTYKTGSQYPTYKKAMDEVFPNHLKWGKYTGVGASCDVFVSTVCRYSGYDTAMPTARLKQEAYLATSPKWTRVNYTFKESDLRSGDIIIYKRSTGSGHICFYVKINGKGCLLEAAYKEKYGFVNTSLKKALSPSSNVISFKVYRANS